MLKFSVMTPAAGFEVAGAEELGGAEEVAGAEVAGAEVAGALVAGLEVVAGGAVVEGVELHPAITIAIITNAATRITSDLFIFSFLLFHYFEISF